MLHSQTVCPGFSLLAVPYREEGGGRRREGNVGRSTVQGGGRREERGGEHGRQYRTGRREEGNMGGSTV